MRRVVVTGMGLITSIGKNQEEVLTSLKESRTGVQLYEPFQHDDIPPKMVGWVDGFEFPTPDPEDWEYPSEYTLNRIQLRPMAPNCLYGFCAMKQAVDDAGLTEDEVSNPRTSIMAASGGSLWISHETLKTMFKSGVQRMLPMSVVGSIPGNLNINLATSFKIKGGALGFASACASSAHSAGHAYDLIKLGRHDRVFVAGAEDVNECSSLPFAAVRALSTSSDPEKSPCAFDKNRDGFVQAGGATVLVLEDLEVAKARGAKIYAEMIGWGQSSDGFNVMAPEPNGEGLARSIQNCLEESNLQKSEVDYVNAHATSTPVGDIAEVKALTTVFNEGHIPKISSTKSLTGHGLSLAGAMEAAFTVLSLKEGFMPVSAHISELDEKCADVPVITEKTDAVPNVAISNSSGFGGSNVTLAFKKWAE